MIPFSCQPSHSWRNARISNICRWLRAHVTWWHRLPAVWIMDWILSALEWRSKTYPVLTVAQYIVTWSRQEPDGCRIWSIPSLEIRGMPFWYCSMRHCCQSKARRSSFLPFKFGFRPKCVLNRCDHFPSRACPWFPSKPSVSIRRHFCRSLRVRLHTVLGPSEQRSTHLPEKRCEKVRRPLRFSSD